MFEGRILPLHQYILEQAKLSGTVYNYIIYTLYHIKVTSGGGLLYTTVVIGIGAMFYALGSVTLLFQQLLSLPFAKINKINTVMQVLDAVSH